MISVWVISREQKWVNSGERRCQTQPRSLADFFRRKEGLENAPAACLVHPCAGIAHGDHDVIARRDGQVPLLVVFIERDLGCLDREFAATGHGVGGIDGQVDQDLLARDGSESSWSSSP